MPRPSFLDQTLLSKVAVKLGKDSLDVQPIRQIVSRKASKLGISSESALVLLAKENGIGASNYLRKLDSSKQAEVRDAVTTAFEPTQRNGQVRSKGLAKNGKLKSPTDREAVKVAIEFVLADDQLKDRCRDLLLANRNFDRAINQATLVLEERIRDKAKPPTKMTGEPLVNFAFKEKIAETVLRVKSGDPDDQRGCTQILRGVVPYLRNRTHHHIVKDFSREDALRVCGFIDVLLRVVDESDKIA